MKYIIQERIWDKENSGTQQLEGGEMRKSQHRRLEELRQVWGKEGGKLTDDKCFNEEVINF